MCNFDICRDCEASPQPATLADALGQLLQGLSGLSHPVPELSIDKAFAQSCGFTEIASERFLSPDGPVLLRCLQVVRSGSGVLHMTFCVMGNRNWIVGLVPENETSGSFLESSATVGLCETSECHLPRQDLHEKKVKVTIDVPRRNVTFDVAENGGSVTRRIQENLTQSLPCRLGFTTWNGTIVDIL